MPSRASFLGEETLPLPVSGLNRLEGSIATLSGDDSVCITYDLIRRLIGQFGPYPHPAGRNYRIQAI
jgi:hypothetical protein